jgi:hypothetical protein
MADRLMLAQAVAAAAALALSAGSTAQALTDPTRPPLELMSAATAGAVPRMPLQSILLSSARKGAIINGQYVALGGTYGKAKLVRITPTEVTLKSNQGLEVLQLYPPLEKTSASSGAEGKPEKAVIRP